MAGLGSRVWSVGLGAYSRGKRLSLLELRMVGGGCYFLAVVGFEVRATWLVAADSLFKPVLFSLIFVLATLMA